MLPNIPAESNYVHWLSNCIERYFEAVGFDFYSEIQSQGLEDDYPFDIYAGIEKDNKIKRFSIQVKRPYANNELFWILENKQHDKLKEFSWIIYALPDFTERKYGKVACFHTIFKYPNFQYKKRLHRSELAYYSRFGSIAEKVIKCTFGEKINKNEWLDSIHFFREYGFVNQLHVYLDFTEMKGQIILSMIEDTQR